ncbi:MinD/ParA family protein [Alkalihalobacillus oceani]|uniref:MinD/ParA family protein n=1 Tax=Halalkalibacter oceani TaxID=1653776 RepID=A0A9X2IRL6_9BACI|nr:MinD/ParA family protein [Halalkalibacter oceani]MCM3716572.1 MinD/ParA family protein [Halalkalibacter oceani]
MGQQITISSMKGGVGKTEVAINLAAAIRKVTGKRVVLVDFDIPYGGIAPALGMEKSVTLSDWIRTRRALNEVQMESLVIRHEKSGIDIVPAIADADDLQNFDENDAYRILEQLSSVYDYVIVDTGVDLSTITKTAIQLSNYVLIVSTTQHVSVWNNHQYKEDLLKMGITHDKIGLILNQVPNQKKTNVDLVETILNVYQNNGKSIRNTSYIRFDEKVRKTRDKKSFMYLDYPKHDFSEAVTELMKNMGIIGFTTELDMRTGWLAQFKKVFG